MPKTTQYVPGESACGMLMVPSPHNSFTFTHSVPSRDQGTEDAGDVMDFVYSMGPLPLLLYLLSA